MHNLDEGCKNIFPPNIVSLEGELTSPFQRSLAFSLSLPPLLGLGIHLRPATKGTYPLGNPRRSVRSSYPIPVSMLLLPLPDIPIEKRTTVVFYPDAKPSTS